MKYNRNKITYINNIQNNNNSNNKFRRDNILITYELLYLPAVQELLTAFKTRVLLLDRGANMLMFVYTYYRTARIPSLASGDIYFLAQKL